jgi:hypothetical protein
VLTVATTKTLTINGPFEAGLYQAFSCAGTGKVVFGYGVTKDIYPQWYGATGIAAHDDTDAIKAAVATCKASNTNSRLVVPNGNYGVSAQIDRTGVSIQGSGSTIYGTTFNVLTGFTGTSVFLWDSSAGANGGFFDRSYRISGNAVGTVTGVEFYKETWTGLLEDIQVERMGGDHFYFHGTALAYPGLITMINCRAEGGAVGPGNGITITEGQNITIINPITEGLGKSGINIDSILMTVSGVQIINPWVEAVATASGAGIYGKGSSITISGGKINNYGTLGGSTCHGVWFNSASLSKVDGTSIGSPNEITASFKVSVNNGRWNEVNRMDSSFIRTGLYTNTTTACHFNAGDVITQSKGQFLISNATQIAQNYTVYITPPLGISSATYSGSRMAVTGFLSMAELRAEFLTDPGAGAAAAYTVTVYKNGSPTTLTVSMVHSGSSTPSDVAHIIEFLPGDYFSIKVNASANAAALPIDNLKITIGYLI